MGNPECAGISRDVVGDERALQGRRQRIHPASSLVSDTFLDYRAAAGCQRYEPELSRLTAAGGACGIERFRGIEETLVPEGGIGQGAGLPLLKNG
jgi:hypothetical protein